MRKLLAAIGIVLAIAPLPATAAEDPYKTEAFQKMMQIARDNEDADQADLKRDIARYGSKAVYDCQARSLQVFAKREVFYAYCLAGHGLQKH